MLAYICTAAAAAAAAALALNTIVFELVYVLRGAGQYFWNGIVAGNVPWVFTKQISYLVYSHQMWTSNLSAFNRSFVWFIVQTHTHSNTTYSERESECFRLKANKNIRKKISRSKCVLNPMFFFSFPLECTIFFCHFMK